MKKLVLIACLLLVATQVSGCIPVMAGFIGYAIADHEHMCRMHPEECQ